MDNITFGAAILLLLVVSIDLFVCGFGYGTSKIHVPFKKVLVINIIGSIMIGIGLFVGYWIGSQFNNGFASWLAFGILFGLGLFKFFAWLITKNKKQCRAIRLITWRETIVLGIVLAADGLVVGIGATVDSFGLAFICTVIALSLVTDHLVFWLGQSMGKKVTKRIKLDLSWLSGTLLMILAVVGIFI